MKTTYFRPSIHGWPFDNTWRKSFLYDTVTLNMGFCGGMCWRALQRFYTATPIPRDIQEPVEGEALYNELWDAQLNSVPSGILKKIYDWQNRAEIDHWNRMESLGLLTQREWSKIKVKLNKSQPVTLTLIAHANDYILSHLADSHRVVAYAYDERPVNSTDYAPDGAKVFVTVFIYDPNYKNDDNVYLTFYLGGEDHKIRLRHSKNAKFYGFFLDDKARSYQFAVETFLKIDQCVQTGIHSKIRAGYALTFSWKCRFIPYFCIQVDGKDWLYNQGAQSCYEPKTMTNGKPHSEKQCPVREGSLIVHLELPRDHSTVSVRLLNDPNYLRSVEVDARPAIECYPYIRSRVAETTPQVCDYEIKDADLFIKDPEPIQSVVDQLNTSPFRWINHLSPSMIEKVQGNHMIGMTQAFVDIPIYRLGNIVVPILANFAERNLAAPTRIDGVVKIIKSGQPAQTFPLPSLNSQAQKIFDGFRNNPTDYDYDTLVVFTYTSKDRFNVIAQGEIMFYGRSIIYEPFVDVVNTYNPALEESYLEKVHETLEDVDIIVEFPGSGIQPTPGIPLNPINDPRLEERLVPKVEEILGGVDIAVQFPGSGIQPTPGIPLNLINDPCLIEELPPIIDQTFKPKKVDPHALK